MGNKNMCAKTVADNLSKCDEMWSFIWLKRNKQWILLAIESDHYRLSTTQFPLYLILGSPLETKHTRLGKACQGRRACPTMVFGYTVDSLLTDKKFIRARPDLMSTRPSNFPRWPLPGGIMRLQAGGLRCRWLPRSNAALFLRTACCLIPLDEVPRLEAGRGCDRR